MVTMTCGHSEECRGSNSPEIVRIRLCNVSELGVLVPYRCQLLDRTHLFSHVAIVRRLEHPHRRFHGDVDFPVPLLSRIHRDPQQRMVGQVLRRQVNVNETGTEAHKDNQSVSVCSATTWGSV